ncbi:MAG: hypothetical protein KBT10_07830 [Bacteroidales bacterium]|nr:hypothetical protein [Candidatus Sodaliphilus aphodohippi]
MTVYINEYPVKIFTGARLIDVLRRYLVENNYDLNSENLYVMSDSYGNVVDVDALVKNNSRYEANLHEEDSFDL